MSRREFLKTAALVAGSAAGGSLVRAGIEAMAPPELGDFKIVDMAPRLDEGNCIIAPPILPFDVFTFEARVRLDPFGGKMPQTRYVFRQPSRDSGIDVGLLIHGGEEVGDGQTGILQAKFWDSEGPSDLSTAEPVVYAGPWHHLAMVKDGTELSLFVNGKRVASRGYNGSSPSYASEELVLGAEISSNLDRSLRGEMNWVRISDSARYTDNFSDLLPVRLEADRNTVALWGLQGSFKDSSGHGHDARPVNPLVEFTVATEA